MRTAAHESGMSMLVLGPLPGSLLSHTGLPSVLTGPYTVPLEGTQQRTSYYPLSGWSTSFYKAGDCHFPV